MKVFSSLITRWSIFQLRKKSLPSTNSFVRKLVEMISQIYIAIAQSQKEKKVRRNLSIITQLQKNDPRISAWIRMLCENLILSYLDFIHSMVKKAKQPEAYFEVDKDGLDEIRQILARGQGIVLAGSHTYGFDQAICCLNHLFPEVQILTKSNPTGGSLLMYCLRRLNHLSVTPITVPALRKAITSLYAGGVVAIAIDLHLPEGKYFNFFGQSCRLTDAHTRMAVKTGAKIFLSYTCRSDAGKVRIMFQHVEAPEDWKAKEDLIASWAQRSFQQLEPIILNWPDAWYGLTFDHFSQTVSKNKPSGILGDRAILLSRRNADLPRSSIQSNQSKGIKHNVLDFT